MATSVGRIARVLYLRIGQNRLVHRIGHLYAAIGDLENLLSVGPSPLRRRCEEAGEEATKALQRVGGSGQGRV